ncbi:hypothetical protein GUITHDRAFT_146474 [Guillardia theta CCMP2712]|uniref:RWP-RK domain-containing protein n=1 Tax=Guillardia theta (strain CCMP2712) TaxID=905079 RepID=L1IGS0_GUITC|nr:hypothetical protein GUITHDRAFT_146474 [Guillardia theta CCMP2712]EKX35456.1 hypothetical protein GUITHDRAFT_146474 [Guillardia theta CCMP2712]|eukprot:XP_005822436.1 hypothetical protein GUITHDRAFT_146474 [Guillardia theta CCMP2712]
MDERRAGEPRQEEGISSNGGQGNSQMSERFLSIYPRKKQGETSRSSKLVLQREDILRLQHLRQDEASKILVTPGSLAVHRDLTGRIQGISVTALRNAARRLGINKWPYNPSDPSRRGSTPLSGAAVRDAEGQSVEEGGEEERSSDAMLVEQKEALIEQEDASAGGLRELDDASSTPSSSSYVSKLSDPHQLSSCHHSDIHEAITISPHFMRWFMERDDEDEEECSYHLYIVSQRAVAILC